jgi:LacI family transcriptional regulator
MARALLHRHAQSIGVLFGVVQPASIFSNEYATGLLQGIIEAAAETGYSVTIFTEPWVNAAQSAMRYRDGRTDGVLIVAPPGDCLTVVAGEGPAHGIPSVDIDNEEGARLAIDHLLQLGHRRIAHITGNMNMPSAKGRRTVFLNMMQDAGIEVRPEYIVAGRYNGETAAEAIAELMSLDKPPTAIFAGNDTIAVAAINALREHGLSIPSDISIVGFDDMPISRLLTPPLTTVRQPLIEIGKCAIRLLIELAEGRPVDPTERLIAPELVVRGTTDRPASQ